MRRLMWLVLALGGLVLPPRAPEEAKGAIVYARKVGDGYQLHLMNADGSGDRLLPGQTDPVNLFPTWSPDGRKIAFTSTSGLGAPDFHVTLLNEDGTGRKRIVLPGHRTGMPAWSPDGRQLAFVAAENREQEGPNGEGGPEIYLSSPDGTDVFRLNTGEHGGQSPFYFPDGKRLGFTPDGRGLSQREIMAARLDGSGLERLIESDGASHRVAGANALSPDGKRLLYQSKKAGQTQIALRLRELESRKDTSILEVDQAAGPAMILGPAWAPDGKSLLVTLPSPKGVGLFHVTEDGKTRTRLTPEGVECLSGAWRKPR